MRKHANGLLAGFALAALVLGCHQSSHSSVSTYEFREEGRSEPTQGEVIQEENPRDYHMAPPGQMASPGEMVPPGRPVVEPRRNP